jgi:hypothetical protein
VARSVSAGGSHEAVERVADSVRVLAVKMTDSEAVRGVRCWTLLE